MNTALIQGHPDPRGGHFCHALAGAYADAARQAGHEVRVIDVARLDFALLRNVLEFCGVSPVRSSLIGTVDSATARERALAKVQALGRSAG